MQIRRAGTDDAEFLVRVINLAFQVEKFFIAGDRIDLAQVRDFLNKGEFLVAERGCVADLKSWGEASDKKYFLKLLRGFHKKRWIELNESTGSVRILPPGTSEAQALLQRKKLRTI
jgi:hypothetical protein